MTKAWLLRPMPHNINRMREFIKQSIIAIGWPEISSLSEKSKPEIKNELAHHRLNYSPNELGIATATVDNFVNSMRIDDIIVVPNGNDIYFCKIFSEYFFEQNCIVDGYPHQRKVEWINSPVRRDDIPDSLRQSLRAPRTLADLSHHLEIILELIGDNSTNQEVPETDDSYTIIEYPIRLDTVASIRIPKNITQTEAARLGDFVKTLYFN